MNTCQESLPILQPMNLLLGLWLDSGLPALFTHKNSSPPKIDKLNL